MGLGQRVVFAGSGQRLGPTPAPFAHGFEFANTRLRRCIRSVGAALVVFAGKQAKTQRRIGEQTHLLAVQHFVQTVVHRAAHQAIRVLHRCNAGQAMLRGQAGELHHAIGRFVRHANLAHLAGLHELGHALKLLVNAGNIFRVFSRVKVHDAKGGHMAHRPVDLVEVNHICLQAAQAVFAGLDDVLRRQVRTAIAHPVQATCRSGDLGGQCPLLA